MKWERWHAIAAAAAVVLVGFAGFKKCDSPSAPMDAGVALEPPGRAPDNLLCDLYVAAPNTSWTRLQRGVGGAMGILPTTLPGVLIALTDLDPQLAVELDGTAPMYGVVAGDPADPGVALAMKLVDGRRARGVLADGDTARYTAKDAAGMTQLVPNRSSGERTFELAITQNGYLLVTRHAMDLGRLGPYVTRTLPARPPPGASVVVDIPRGALQSTLKPKLESLWKDGKAFLLTQDERMRAERGRAPDFGDPAAIVAAIDAALGRRVAILGDLERVRIAIDVTEDAAVLDATLTPVKEAGPARKWVEGMHVGDASGVLALPAVSALAMSTRDGEAERAEQAKDLEKAIASALGPRLKEPEKLHDVIESMTKARDESMTFALGLDEPSGVLVHAPVRDADAAQKAIRGTFDLARAEPFKQLLRLRDVTSASEELPGVGKVSLVTLVRETKRTTGSDAGAPRRPVAADAGAAAGKAPAGIGVAWIVEEAGAQKTVALGAGSEPLVTLKTGARPDRKLADEPSLKHFAMALGKDATTVIIGQPLRLDPSRANLPTAPLGIAIGKKGSDAFVRIDIADGLLREAARWQLGF